MFDVFQTIFARFQRANTVNDRLAKFSWRDEPELMARLTAAQNALRAPIDIMTFAGFCDSRDELLAHVARYEAQVAEGR